MSSTKLICTLLVALFAGILSGCPCGTGSTPVQMTAFSGRFGYYLAGPYGFEGALTKSDINSPTWTLEGTFQFPTSGYSVLGPSILVAESFPEQVTIRMRVLLPPEGSAQLTVITPVTVRYTVDASNQASFNISVEELCFP